MSEDWLDSRNVGAGVITHEPSEHADSRSHSELTLLICPVESDKRR